MSAMRYEDFKYRAENVVKLNKDKTAMRYLLENKKGDDKGADIISFSFGEIFEKMQNIAEILRGVRRKAGRQSGNYCTTFAVCCYCRIITGICKCYGCTYRRIIT